MIPSITFTKVPLKYSKQANLVVNKFAINCP